MSSSSVFIEVKDFHKSFKGKVVHQGVNFKVHKGECLGLIGGSGSGKSVLLRSLIGLEKPDKGQIIVDGTDIVPLDEDHLLPVRKKVAYAFQGGALFDSLSVFENLAYPLREHSKLSEAEVRDKILNQLAEFGLAGSDGLFPNSLSGGMQKRVGLARAMMLNPEVVLYDEPTAGLDPYNTKVIQDSINQLKAKGMTSILVTHDMPTAFAVCDRMVFLSKGTIAEEKTILEMKNPNEKSLMGRFILGEAV